MSKYENQLPALPYPDKTPAKIASSVPVISADALQHVGRYSNLIVMACFEQLGGLERMVEWAQTSPSDFYTKIFVKTMTRSNQTEHSGTVTLDDAITRLESQTIEADYEEVEPTYDL